MTVKTPGELSFEQLISAFVRGETRELAAEPDPALPAPEAIKRRVLAAATWEGRFDRFAAAASDLLQVPQREAKRLLDQLGDPAVWVAALLPGMVVHPVAPGASLRETLAWFVRVPAGLTFPEHKHYGPERALIIQGSCDDRGQILRPGDILEMAADTSHSFEIRPGPDLLFLVVIQRGFRMGEIDVQAPPAD